MVRITPSQVISAYESVGYRPMRWSTLNVTNKCACPIAVLYVNHYDGVLPRCPENRYNNAELAIKWAEHQFGKEYTSGFVNGFDGRDIAGLGDNGDDWEKGYFDGVKCYQVVRDNFRIFE